MIVIATADLSASPFDDPDDAPLRAALTRAGLDFRVQHWDDEAGWDGAELIVLRSTWDYVQRIDEFTRWLHRVSAVSRVLNPLPVIEWNSHKGYLGQLEARGVPVVPTRYLDRIEELAPALAQVPGPEVVVKPSVSNGSGLTGRFGRDDPGARGLAGQILAAGKQIMLQPYLESVTTQGEAALVFIGGRFSHAVRKGPLLEAGGGLLGGSYTEVISAITPTPDQLDVAGQVLRAAGELTGSGGAGLLYARVDLVAGADGQPLCLELEAIEPSLFFDQGEGSADRFVQALAARL